MQDIAKISSGNRAVLNATRSFSIYLTDLIELKAKKIEFLQRKKAVAQNNSFGDFNLI